MMIHAQRCPLVPYQVRCYQGLFPDTGWVLEVLPVLRDVESGDILAIYKHTSHLRVVKKL
jgi:hypothetical protein